MRPQVLARGGYARVRGPEVGFLTWPGGLSSSSQFGLDVLFLSELLEPTSCHCSCRRGVHLSCRPRHHRCFLRPAVGDGCACSCLCFSALALPSTCRSSVRWLTLCSPVGFSSRSRAQPHCHPLTEARPIPSPVSLFTTRKLPVITY